MAAITPAEYVNLSLLSRGLVDGFAFEAESWLLAQLDVVTAEVYGVLRKRYAVPFVDPPTIVKGWVAAIVDLRLLVKTGVSPLDVVYETTRTRVEAVNADIRGAADGENGLLELVETGDAGPSAAVAPVTFVSSQASPYVWQDDQRTQGIMQDASRR